MDNFFLEVYKIVEGIPEGKVLTYSRIAAMLGRPKGARIVGWAMRAVPEGSKLPSHRVVKKSGELAPCHVFGDISVQRALLEKEGVTFKEDGRIDMESHLWKGEG